MSIDKMPRCVNLSWERLGPFEKLQRMQRLQTMGMQLLLAFVSISEVYLTWFVRCHDAHICFVQKRKVKEH